MSDYKPLPNESWVEFFRRTRKFADLMLMVWSLMEDNIDQVFASQQGLFFEDKKAQKLLDTSFANKINFLKKRE